MPGAIASEFGPGSEAANLDSSEDEPAMAASPGAAY